MTDRDWNLSLKNRAARLARLAELGAPLNVLANERQLVDIAFLGLANQMTTLDEQVVHFDRCRRFIADLRAKTDTGDYRLNETAAIELFGNILDMARTQGVVDQCEKHNCEWFRKSEQEAKA